MNTTPYSSKLLLDGQYGIYINEELVVLTASRDRLQKLMAGLQERTKQNKKSDKSREVA